MRAQGLAGAANLQRLRTRGLVICKHCLYTRFSFLNSHQLEVHHVPPLTFLLNDFVTR